MPVIGRGMVPTLTLNHQPERTMKKQYDHEKHLSRARALDSRSRELGLTADREETLETLTREYRDAFAQISREAYENHLVTFPEYEKRGGSFTQWKNAEEVRVKYGPLNKAQKFRVALAREYKDKFGD